MAVRGVEQPLFLGYEPSVIIPFHSTATKGVGFTHFSLHRLVLMINSAEIIKPTSNDFNGISMLGKQLTKACFVSSPSRIELLLLG